MSKILANWALCPDGTMIPSMYRHDYREHVSVDTWKRVHKDDIPEPDTDKVPMSSEQYQEWLNGTTLEIDSSRHTMVDGGNDYIRRGGAFTDMTVYDDDPFEVIRRFLCRGGRGKNNDQPLTYVPLFKMGEEWLQACIDYNNERGIDGHNKWYQKELDYRNKHKK